MSKTFKTSEHEIRVLNDVNLLVRAGDTCAIVGPSGSGKTTLLALCAGLDEVSAGHITLDSASLNELDEDERAALRNRSVGFVFQNFQLIPSLTAIENVLVPLELRGARNQGKLAVELLEQVGLGQRLNHYPAQLSGGEQQRVALARAYINRPKILFADEPTGNLDSDTSKPIVDMLLRLNRDSGTALVLVTHDLGLAEQTQRIVKMSGGEIVGENAGRG